MSQTELGPKVQVYPAGVITSFQLITGEKEKSAWMFEVGYNQADRQDFGVHNNEVGGGIGFGTGYRKYLQDGKKGFYLDGNLEMWFLEIDWEDDASSMGTTDITVLQPTIGGGYQFRSKSEDWAATLGVAFGREWNIKTAGEEIGQGGISLATITITRRL